MEKVKIIESAFLHVRQENELKESKAGEQSNYWTADVWKLDEMNLNGRIYTRSLAERIVQEQAKTMCYDGHDADFATGHDYAPAIGYCDNPRIEDGRLVVDVHFLESQENSDSVRNIRELYKAGLPIGVSSVGYGSIDADGVIGDDYEVVRFLDFVASPAGQVYASPKAEEKEEELPPVDEETKEEPETVVDGEGTATEEAPATEAEEVSETSESEVSEETDADAKAEIEEEDHTVELTEEKLAEERIELDEARKIKESFNMTETIKKNKYSEESLNWINKFQEAVSIGTSYRSLVPTEIANRVEMKMQTYGQLRKYCTIHKMAGSYSFAVEDEGAVALWKAEGAQVGETTPSATPIVLTAQSLAAIVKVSKELAADSDAMMDYVVDSLAKGFAKAEDKAILTGAGFVSGVSNEPAGIITKLKNQSNTPQIVAGAAGTTSTIGFTWANLKAVIGKIGEHRKGAVVICNQTTADHIYEMKDNGKYIFDQTKALDNIWGMPVIVTDLMDDAYTQASSGADAYPVVVANLGFYHIGDRQDLEVQTLTEAFAANRQIGILADKRLDGNFGNYSAFAALKVAKAS